MKALAAGKHVLLEKPSANTSEETRKMFAYAQEKGLILMEAFHYRQATHIIILFSMCSEHIPDRFHPATRRLKEIVDSGELGTITKIDASLAVPHIFVKDGDIRLVYELGGGAMMDMGCEFDSYNFPVILMIQFLPGYTLSMLRYITGADPTKVISAKADVNPKYPEIDIGTTATLSFPSPEGSTGPADGLTGTLYAHLSLPPLLGFLPRWPKLLLHVTGTCGTVRLNYFPGPWLYHSITVESSEHEGGPMRKRTEKQYGSLGWTTSVSLRSHPSPLSDVSAMYTDIVIS